MTNRSGPDYFLGQILGERSRQEDAIGIGLREGATRPDLLVVADGMGGHAGGNVASGIATRAVVAAFEAGSDGGPTDVPDRLRAALASANDAVVQAVTADPSLEGMGTTLVAIAATPAGFHWISVGDSPLWRLTASGVLQRLNEDHSMRAVLMALVAKGEMSREQAMSHPHRNQLRSVVGHDDVPLVDASREPLRLAPGDWLIAASDGIETLPEDEIARIVAAHGPDPASAGQALLAAVEAAAAPKQDNMTVCLWRAGDDALTAPAADWEEPLEKTVILRPSMPPATETTETTLIGSPAARVDAPRPIPPSGSGGPAPVLAPGKRGALGPMGLIALGLVVLILLAIAVFGFRAWQGGELAGAGGQSEADAAASDAVNGAAGTLSIEVRGPVAPVTADNPAEGSAPTVVATPNPGTPRPRNTATPRPREGAAAAGLENPDPRSAPTPVGPRKVAPGRVAPPRPGSSSDDGTRQDGASVPEDGAGATPVPGRGRLPDDRYDRRADDRYYRPGDRPW